MDYNTRPIIIHRHWRSVVLNIITAVIVSGVVFRVSVNSDFFGFSLPITENFSITFPYFLVILAAFMVRPLILLYDSRNEIGEHHLRAYSGLCSWKRKFSELAYENIRGVEVDQNILERILDVGSIKVWTAVSGTPEIVMRGIDNPEGIAKLLRKQLDDIHTEDRTTQATSSSRF